MPTSLKAVPDFLAEAFERKGFAHDIGAQNIFGLLVLKHLYGANVEVTTDPGKFPSYEEITTIIERGEMSRLPDNLRGFWQEVNERIFHTNAAHRYELSDEQIEGLVQESIHHLNPLLAEVNIVIIGGSTGILGDITTIWHANK